MTDALVVIPIRAFSDAKSRLAPAVSGAERARLMRTMAERVVAAARPTSVVVVSSAPDVLAWAEGIGLDVVPDPGSLDAAADAGRQRARDLGIVRVVVAHGDLPLVESLAPLVEPGPAPVAVVVPCHRDDGTPLLSLPASSSFRFAYGPGSFARHVAEAHRVSLGVIELWDDPRLRRDLDLADDLDSLAQLMT